MGPSRRTTRGKTAIQNSPRRRPSRSASRRWRPAECCAGVGPWTYGASYFKSVGQSSKHVRQGRLDRHDRMERRKRSSYLPSIPTPDYHPMSIRVRRLRGASRSPGAVRLENTRGLDATLAWSAIYSRLYVMKMPARTWREHTSIVRDMARETTEQNVVLTSKPTSAELTYRFYKGMSKSSYGVGNATFNFTYSKEAGLDFESSPLEPRIGSVK